MNSRWVKLLPGFIGYRQNAQVIIANVSWLVADKILRMGVGLIVGVWIARYLGPEQFGLWNFAIAFVSLFGAFATLGLDGVVVRELVREPLRHNEIMGSAFALKLAGAALVFLLVVIVISFMRKGDELTLWLVCLSAAGFIFQSLNVIDFHFQAKVRAKYTVYASNAAFLLMTFLKIYLLLTAAPLIAFAWVGLGEVALTAIFLLLAYRFDHLCVRDWRFDLRVMRDLLRDSWPLLLAGLAVMLYMRIDMVMLQQMSGEREVGIYAAATRLSEVWYFLPSVIVASVSPAIIKAHQADQVAYVDRLRRVYAVLAWLAIGIALPLSLLSDWLVYLLYGAEYSAAAPVLAMHLWASIAVFLGVASSQYLLVEGLQKISLYRTLLGLCCNMVLNLVLIPSHGAMGVAIATVLSYFLATFSLVLFPRTRSHAWQLFRAPFLINRAGI